MIQRPKDITLESTRVTEYQKYFTENQLSYAKENLSHFFTFFGYPNNDLKAEP